MQMLFIVIVTFAMRQMIYDILLLDLVCIVLVQFQLKFCCNFSRKGRNRYFLR